MKRMNFPSRRKDRREDAENRQKLRDKRSTTDQMNHLVLRSHGHCKEYNRLQRLEEKRRQQARKSKASEIR